MRTAGRKRRPQRSNPPRHDVEVVEIERGPGQRRQVLGIETDDALACGDDQAGFVGLVRRTGVTASG